MLWLAIMSGQATVDIEAALARRQAAARGTIECDRAHTSTFLAGCGVAGVSFGTRSGVSLVSERPLAP